MKSCADGIGDPCENDRHRAGRLQHHSDGGRAAGQDDIRRERHQFRCEGARAIGIAVGIANNDLHIFAVGPAQLLQRLLERSDVGPRARIVRVGAA